MRSPAISAGLQMMMMYGSNLNSWRDRIGQKTWRDGTEPELDKRRAYARARLLSEEQDRLLLA